MMLFVIGTLFLATLLIGVPVAFGMGFAGATWILFFQGMEPALLVRRFCNALDSFPLLSIPLFIMLGVLTDRARMLPHLVTWLRMMFGRLKGGMAYINVVAAMLFSGISGTAVSDIASLGRVLISLMTRAGYPASYAAALTAATSIIGPIIPPSVIIIIYALAVGNASIGALFAGATLPGILFGLGFLVMAWYTTRKHNFGVRLEAPTAGDFMRQTLRVMPLMMLPVIIVGGMFSGLFTVTESAAAGVAYTLVIGFMGTPRLKLADIYDAIVYSAVISSVAGLFISVGALISWILTYNQVTQTLADFLIGLTTDPMYFMLIVASALLICGMFIDCVPITIALAPILSPIAQRYGVPDVQFALVFIVTTLIGLVMPPAGIILFMTSSISGVKVETLSAAVFPFAVWMTAVVVLMIVFPWLTLWLPAYLGF
jgi:tripartite ATP-independent transporter DctM subunit